MPIATAPAHRMKDQGFTLLELVVVVALVGILIGVAAKRLLPYVAQAESVAVMRLEGQLQNVLVLEAAMRIARGQSARLGELRNANPMAFLLEPPVNYLGELRAPTRDLLPRRSWHFDTRTQRLVYRAGRALELSRGAAVISEYEVRLRFEDRDGNRRFTPGTDEFHGVLLERVDTSHFGAEAALSSQVLGGSADTPLIMRNHG